MVVLFPSISFYVPVVAEQRMGGIVKGQTLFSFTMDRKVRRAILVYTFKGQGT